MKTIQLILCFGFFLAWVACNPNPQQPGGGDEEGNEAVDILRLEKDTVYAQACVGENCSTAHLEAFKAFGGNQALRDSVEAFTYGFSSESTDMEGSSASKSLQETADEFVLSYKEFMEEEEDEDFMSMGWEIETTADILHETENFVAISMGAYSYMGGAHPNYFLQNRTIQKEDGRSLNLVTRIKNEAALMSMLEAAAREGLEIPVGESLQDFGFFEEKLPLPANMTPMAEGVNFYYNPYEVGPYAMGDVEFDISYKKLAAVMDVEGLE